MKNKKQARIGHKNHNIDHYIALAEKDYLLRKDGKAGLPKEALII